MPVNKRSKGDYAHSLIKGLIGAIPIAGALSSEILSVIITPPLERRRNEWLVEVENRLIELNESKLIDLEDLRKNNHFIDIVIQTTSLALKTHEKDKFEAYKNILINTSLNIDIDQTIAKIYIHQLEKFTPLHLKILKFINNPQMYFESIKVKPKTNISGSLSQVIFQAFPELESQKELLNLVWNDLRSCGFHNFGDVQSSMSGTIVFTSRTTKFGKDFIEFIEQI